MLSTVDQRWSTVDHTDHIQLCVQHDGSEAACHAHSAAAAEMCGMLDILQKQAIYNNKKTRSHPDMVGDTLHVTLNFDLSIIPFVHF